MVGSSKILTVSYGTFSCTLEGFDDSFSTMKAIAEYFRDLAADDRYFGAEPPTPDADMLARIAEKEISRRVEARTSAEGIVLRAGNALTAAPAPTAPEASPAPQTAPVKEEAAKPEAPATQPEAEAARKVEAPAAVQEAPAPQPSTASESDDLTDITDATAAEAAPSHDLAGANEEDAATSSELLATAPASAPLMPPEMAEPEAAGTPEAAPARPAIVRPSPVRAAPEAEAPTTAAPSPLMPTPRVAERPRVEAKVPAHPDSESVAAKLQRIRAVVSRSAPMAEGVQPAQTLTPAATEPQPAAQDLASDEADAAQEPSSLLSPVAAPASDDAAAAIEEAPAQNELRARVIKMRRADFEAAVASGSLLEETDEDEAPAPAAPAAVLPTDDSTLSEEDEADLQAELASLEDEDIDDTAEMAALDDTISDDEIADLSALDGFDEDDSAEDDTSEEVMSDDEMADDEMADDDLSMDGDDDFDDEDLAETEAENDADLADRDDDIAEDTDRELAAIAAIVTGATPRADAEEDADDAEVAEAHAEAGQREATEDETETADAGEEDITAADLGRNIRSALAASLAGAEADDALSAGSSDENLFAGDSAEFMADDAEFAYDTADRDDRAEDDETADDNEMAFDDATDEDASDDDAASLMRPRRVRLPADPDTDALERIAEQTDAAMDAPENRSRRDAISQLKAAVAATEAARRMGEPSEEAADEDSTEDAFRDDLRQVVRPRRPVRTEADDRTERPRPAPLKLVASQRVDAPVATPRATAHDAPVRPRRVSLAPTPVAPAVSDTSFAEFAAEMGAHDLSDRMEAAAAFAAFVEGAEDVSRPQLMAKVQELSETPVSREDGLRSFGALLRQGRLVKVRNGRFAVAGDTRFNPERRAG